MKVILYMTATQREKHLIDTVRAGFKRHGVETKFFEVKQYQKADPHFDLAVFVGVRRKSARIYRHSRAINQPTLMIDKGYFRRDLSFHRFSINGPQPYYVTQVQGDRNRLRELGVKVAYKPQPPAANKVVYAGASDKYSIFHSLGGSEETLWDSNAGLYPEGSPDKLMAADTYTTEVCSKLHDAITKSGKDLKLVYRPQPSWWQRKEFHYCPPNATISLPDERFGDVLSSCYCLATHGSNAGVEAALAGVPVLSTGDPTTNPLHDLVNTSFDEAINAPKRPTEAELEKRLAALAWCQFKYDEISNGFAWDTVKQWVK